MTRRRNKVKAADPRFDFKAPTYPIAPNYKGELALPIPIPLVSLPAELDRANQMATELRARKMELLMGFHNIPFDAPNRWELLAYALAVHHVDGFKISAHAKRQRRRDEPIKWTPQAKQKLIADVTSMSDTEKISLEEACARLVENGVYSGTEESLYQRYREFNTQAKKAKAQEKQDEAEFRAKLVAAIELKQRKKDKISREFFAFEDESRAAGISVERIEGFEVPGDGE